MKREPPIQNIPLRTELGRKLRDALVRPTASDSFFAEIEARIMAQENTMKVDWSAMTGEEIIEAVKSAPVVMHPWRGWNGAILTEAVGVFFSRHSENAMCMLREGSQYACVQPLTPGLGWAWTLYDPKAYNSGFATAAEAIADVDREMLSRGWKLIGPSLKESGQ